MMNFSNCYRVKLHIEYRTFISILILDYRELLNGCLDDLGRKSKQK